MLRLLPIFALAALGGCGKADDGNPAFRASGQLIAFSGSDGGAANACAVCHGLEGEGDGRLAPRLAGLDPGYLHRQLDDYANGRREDAQMRAVVRRLSGEDRASVSAYYAALPPPATALPRTSHLYAQRCASCHGPRGEGLGPANPPLAGQPPAYVEAQLKAWQSGRRRDPLGMMSAIARDLTPAEIDLLASHGEVPHPPAHPPRVPAAYR